MMLFLKNNRFLLWFQKLEFQKYQLAKDLFLFSVYTGLRYTDVMSLEISNIVHVNGETWIIKKAEKNINSTEIPVKIPIETLFNGKALAIIKKYSQKYDFNVFFKPKEVINSEIVKNKITFHFLPCEFTVGGFWAQISTADCGQSRRPFEPPSETGKRPHP